MEQSNLDRYKTDLDKLINSGRDLELALIAATNHRAELEQLLTKEHGAAKAKSILKALPRFEFAYQAWYSEAKALIGQLLPNRLDDFVRHYEKPKGRKDITFENYRIEDALQGLHVTRNDSVVVDAAGSIPHMQQQLAILRSVKARFGSSLFDIRQLVQADLFDSELDAARELATKRFLRAAGAVAGVVLERHLREVCEKHSVKITKKNPGINDLNQALKDADVIETPQWRGIQHLGDLRNLCDHDKEKEPTREQVDDLLAGVAKTIKTLF